MAQLIDRAGGSTGGGDDKDKKAKSRTPIDLDAALQEVAKTEKAKAGENKAASTAKAKARAKAKKGGKEIPQPLIFGVLGVIILAAVVWAAVYMLGGDKRPSLEGGTAGFGTTGGKPPAGTAGNGTPGAGPGAVIMPNAKPLYGSPTGRPAIPGSTKKATGGEAGENGIGN